jgi:hypothetical protein
MVRGTFKADNNDVGIRVNGAIAEISGEEWVANGVRLSVGQNTLEAVITEPKGNTSNHTITVHTESTEQAVRLSANTVSGIPPLDVYFSVDTDTPNPITQYQMDFEGDGSADYTGAEFEDISHTYTAEGVYFPTVTVTDGEGNAYSDTIAVTVLSREEMDALLKGKWEGLKEALLAGNTEDALDLFTFATRDHYQKTFANLGAELSVIMSSLEEFKLYTIYDGVAEGGLIRTESGGTYSYPITFIRDGRGIWRIYSL